MFEFKKYYFFNTLFLEFLWLLITFHNDDDIFTIKITEKASILNNGVEISSFK